MDCILSACSVCSNSTMKNFGKPKTDENVENVASDGAETAEWVKVKSQRSGSQRRYDHSDRSPRLIRNMVEILLFITHCIKSRKSRYIKHKTLIAVHKQHSSRYYLTTHLVNFTQVIKTHKLHSKWYSKKFQYSCCYWLLYRTALHVILACHNVPITVQCSSCNTIRKYLLFVGTALASSFILSISVPHYLYIHLSIYLSMFACNIYSCG